jgi:hypothetical protein
MAIAPMNLRQNPLAGMDYAQQDPLTIDLATNDQDNSTSVDPDTGVVKIEFPDGSVTINLGGGQKKPKEDQKFEDNIALELDSGTLGQIASELHRLIQQDDESRAKLLQQYVAGLELLGTEIQKPSSNASDGSTAVEGQATVRNPLLLEAIVRFQANARGELLPSSGPVKIRNDGLTSLVSDIEAEALEKDFNHYLTVTAKEYYPDTERMHFSLAFIGTSFKKVYYCPLRRRPVSEFVDIRDVIISDAETSAQTAQRVTHVIKMAPSVLKRMQLMGVYRNVTLSLNAPPKKNVADEKIDQMSGVVPNTTSMMETETREIWECYCELDIPGFEHEDDQGPTGLKLPYRVTMDKNSQEILEIRRWWKENDPQYMRRHVFVDYIFVPGFGFYGLGFLHLLGNTTMALTAGWRLCIDNGMFSNFPGFLYAKQAGRQNSNEFRVPPGGGMPIETNGQPINNVVMPLPYKSVDAGFLNLLQLIEQNGQRMAATTETNVGEGNSEAPVGTTIALIEQAQKVMSAVHKRMHAAQAVEFQLLKELFKESPESFWANNEYPAHQWTPETLTSALNNINLVPVADPNTPSQSARIQKAMAIKQLQSANPGLYDARKVDERILTMLGVEDAQSLFAPPAPPNQQPDPMTMMAQAKVMDSQARMADVKVKETIAASDAQNHAADRESKERIAMLQLASKIAVHPESANEAQQFIKPDIEGLVNNPNV